MRSVKFTPASLAALTPARYGVEFPRRHEGHSGITIEELSNWVPSPGTSTVPDIVLLMIGTNDVYSQLYLRDAPRRLGKLIDRVIAAYPRAQLVVSTLIPMSDEVPAGPVETYNAALQPIVEQRAQKPIQLVDMYGGFPADGLDDVVHPNAAGFRHMAGVWYAVIREFHRL